MKNPTGPEAEAAEASVLRLSSKENFPFLPEGRAALVQTFLDAFPTTLEIDRAVDDILRYDKRCPHPEEVWERAKSMGFLPGGNPHKDCPVCDGTGWEPITMRVGDKDVAAVRRCVGSKRVA